MVRIADRLYSWRHSYRLSQGKVADLLGVSVRTLGRWERGASAPNEEHLEELRRMVCYPPPGWVRS